MMGLHDLAMVKAKEANELRAQQIILETFSKYNNPQKETPKTPQQETTDATPPKIIEEPMRPTHRLANGYLTLLKEKGHQEDLIALKIALPGNDINNMDNLYKQTLANIKAHIKKHALNITEKQLDQYAAKEAQRERTEHALKEEERTTPYTVSSLLAQKKPKEATELIVEYIIKRNHIYTTRQDEHSEMWIYHEGIYIPQGRTYIQEHCRRILDASYTTYLCNQVISKIEADTYITQEEFFKPNPPNLTPVQNGIIDLNTGKITPFTPELKFFNKLPLNYDKTKKCPSILKFFKSLFTHENEIDVIQEIFGFLLYDEYFIEKAIMLNGYGRNGKSKTLELMKLFLGHENCIEISLEQLETDGFALANLFKKKANLCGDLSKTALKQTGSFKKLTGRDLVTANRKFLSPVTFNNTAKLVFSCNEIPIIYDDTDAFWMRWIFLTFPYTFVPASELKHHKDDSNYRLADPDIIKKLTSPEELSGLLNWAIDGLARLLSNKDFSHSPSTADVKEWWTRKSDSFKAFCMDRVDNDWDEYITKAELKKAYSLFCRSNKAVVTGDKHIKYVLSTLFGVEETRLSNDTRDHIWKGIRLKQDSSIGITEIVYKPDSKPLQNTPIGKNLFFCIESENHIQQVGILIGKNPIINSDLIYEKFGEKITKKMVSKGVIYLRSKDAYAMVEG